MTNQQIIEQLKYIIACGVPKHVEGILLVLCGTLRENDGDSEMRLFNHLITFAEDAIARIG